MLNFTVGPVRLDEEIASIGGEQVPYFRTPEFSELMLENERLLKVLADAEHGSRAVFITGSGTAAMEAAVMNVLTPHDRAIVIDGGSFGHRFVELCQIHGIPHTALSLDAGKALTVDDLAPYADAGYTTLLVNICETSTGVRYDPDLIGGFCRRNGLFLVVDAISSFLADRNSMRAHGIDVMIIGSQKALACPPGISALVLSKNALGRIEGGRCGCLYLDLRRALADGARGQTPFTPAVGILRQINARMLALAEAGGSPAEIARIGGLAMDFRKKVRKLPFEITAASPSNAVTPLHPLRASAHDVFDTLKNEYQIWVCPNGGSLGEFMFRVGHLGALTKRDNDVLIAALGDMRARNLL